MRRLTWIRAVTLAATAVGVCAISACEGREAVSSARALPTTSSSAAPPTSQSPSSSVRPPASPATAPTSPAPPASESTPPTSAGSAAPEPRAAAERLGVADNPRLGPIVVDGDGMTLYRLGMDGTAGFQPVLLPDGASVEVDGVDPALLGTVRRADGGTHLTFADAALYRFTGDSAPGETNGRGAEGGAFAITPTGQRAGATS